MKFSEKLLGDIKFVDRNGDGEINSDDLGDIGNPWPKHIIGLSLNLEYKGFYLNTILNTQIGHQIYRTYERSEGLLFFILGHNSLTKYSTASTLGA